MSEKLEQKIAPESKEKKKLKITIIDDNGCLLAEMKFLFPKDKYEVFGPGNPVHSVEEAIELIKKTMPDAVILDMNLTEKYEKEGLKIAKIIREEYPNTEIIINSSDWEDPSLKKEFEKLGISRGVSKTEIKKLPEVLEEWTKEKAEGEKEEIEKKKEKEETK